jgi:tetratricopeptide (TPR) repeat protein
VARSQHTSAEEAKVTSHIDSEQIALYVDGALESSRAVSEHLKGCAQCRAAQGEISGLLADLSALPTSREPSRDLWPAIAATMAGDTDTTLANLREAIATRQIATATRLIDGLLDCLRRLQRADPNAPALLNYFAQWMDLGFTDRDCQGMSAVMLLRSCFARIPHHPWLGLLGSDIVHLRIVEGIIAVYSEDYDSAIRHFSAVVALELDVADADLLVFAERALARAYTRQGQYTKAREHVEHALALAGAAERSEMAAACAVLKAWLLFQVGKNDEAVALLNLAETVLRETDDSLSLANIGAALGRIERRMGRYGASARLYVESIEQYRRCKHRRNHLARALVNFAFVNRLLAVRVESGQRDVEVSDADPTGDLRKQAAHALDEAEYIYGASRDGRGRGMVLLVRAYLEMDSGHWSRAEFAAAEAYELGRRYGDLVLRIRARVQQCRVVHTQRQVSLGDPLKAVLDTESVDGWIEEAMHLAATTELEHLRANTLTWRGITHLQYAARVADAHACYDEAKQRLQTLNVGDYALDELRLLKAMLEDAGPLARKPPMGLITRRG